MKISNVFVFLAALIPSLAFGLSNQELNVDSVDSGPEVSTINDNLRRLNGGKLDLYPRGIAPFRDSRYDLGESGREWRRLYVDGITVSTITASSATITSVSATTGTFTSVVVTTLTLNGNILSAATQAQQETATSTTVFVSPGREQYHPSSAKAWVVFQGTGTVTIRRSFNISSITDNGVGDYTVNFTTAFSDANYAMTGSTDANNVSVVCGRFSTTAPTTTAARIGVFSDTGAAEDDAWVSVVFFGDQ